MEFEQHQSSISPGRDDIYSVGKKPPTPILCVTEKMEQNRDKVASTILCQ